MATKLETRSWRVAGLLGLGLVGCTSAEGDGPPADPPPLTGTTSSNGGAASNAIASAIPASSSVPGSSDPGAPSAASSATPPGVPSASTGVAASASVEASDAGASPGNTTGDPDGGPPTEATSTATNNPNPVPSTANNGTCTPSERFNRQASGSGPHEVTIETNSDPGINEGTIFRPSDLGGDEKYPIFVWGQGACSLDGLANANAMAEIASHGYFVVADGTPNGTEGRNMDRSQLAAMGAPLIAYIDWAIAENEKPCSAYYQSLDVEMIASNGFSCGGLMAQGTVSDPRIVTWGVTSSGMAGADQAFYDSIHTPVLFVEGGPDEVAYDGALGGYEEISTLGVPVLWFSKNIGHGGDLFTADGGDFTKLNLAWLNWWLKGDETATGKGMLVGASCPYCSDSEWEVMSAGVP
jgi:dienelactone hydrolase